MPEANKKITMEEAKGALLKSGYLLETRLEKILIENEFVVTSNYIFPDPHEKKSREIDLSAIKCNEFGPDNMDCVSLDPTIECINNDHPIAFFTKEPKFDNFYPYSELKIIGQPEKINDEILAHYYKMSEYHHYYRGDIATQWCTFYKKKIFNTNKKEWAVWHFDDYHKTFQKLCFVIKYLIDETKKNLDRAKKQRIDIHLYYPILVTQNEIYSVVQDSGDITISEEKHIKYLRTEYLSGEFCSNRIDVVTEDYFPTLLTIIEDEFQKTTDKIKNDYAKLKEELHEVFLA